MAVALGGIRDVGAMAAMGVLGVMGTFMFGSSAVRLPGWARTRSRQMNELAAQLETMRALKPPAEPQ